MKNLFALVAFVLASSGSVLATEPAYCDPAKFQKFRIPSADLEMSRLRIFQLGSVKLAGMAIGSSPAENVRGLAESVSNTTASQNFCTWYVNEGDAEAEAVFHHAYVPNPRKRSPAAARDEYLAKLAPYFENRAKSFIACARDTGYIGVGCNGQRHRGPTVFGMILAFSGCTPEHAAEIVNGLWGLNSIPAENRLAVIRGAYELGSQRTEERALFRRNFER